MYGIDRIHRCSDSWIFHSHRNFSVPKVTASYGSFCHSNLPL